VKNMLVTRPERKRCIHHYRELRFAVLKVFWSRSQRITSGTDLHEE